ncbi:hypothetical protein CDL15_Pgr027654 [Punica granatum]|uniref:UPF3 domain-containing protein n=1 Tax=Punica granatum TaxID=22663 RepID=A0A218XIV1_PUNGR|nr:hypothetical protein CDL15_Pgr027654 [Punica granatum]
MKGHLDRTKVVLRHLPPSITQEMLMDQIDTVFGGRYNWVSFRPGKTSLKHLTHSRAYINFIKPEDVIEFAEFFDGHVFVNEKGAQYKTIVEYAPSQRVPKQRSKKDGREGTILKDPEYMEFLEFLAKPVENLPSAEVQLERREAERSAAPKDAPVVTPLMDFVRQKRASKGTTRRSSSNGKLSRRAGKLSDGSPGLSKRNSEKRRTSATMYVLRDNARNSGSRDKSAYVLVPKRDEHLHSDKSNTTGSASGADVVEENSGVTEFTDSGKKKILLLKGKEREIPHISGNISQMKNVMGSSMSRQNHRQEGSGRIIKSILVNKEARQGLSAFQSDNQTQTSYLDREKRPPRAPNVQVVSRDANGFPEEKSSVTDSHGFGSEKQERRTRNKDRPDRGVWAPLRRSDGSHASDESISSASSSVKSLVDSSEGFHKPVGRRGQSQGGKDLDGSPISTEGKPSKRGGALGYGSHEKQVWVQKSSSGS